MMREARDNASHLTKQAEALLYKSRYLVKKANRPLRRKQRDLSGRPSFAVFVARAAQVMGGGKALATACGVKQGTIWATINQKSRLPPWLAVKIVDATGGQVSIKDLLPDVYQRVEAELGERVLQP